MVGTIVYSAPELMEVGKKSGVAADVYSLTLVLFELFSGKSPYPGDQMQVFNAKKEDIKPEFPDNFPAELRVLIERGWLKEAMKRPQIREFRTALLKMIGDDEYITSFIDNPDYWSPGENKDQFWSLWSKHSMPKDLNPGSGCQGFHFIVAFKLIQRENFQQTITLYYGHSIA